MAEAHQARMQNVVEEMVQSLERDHIRKMQVGVSIFFYYVYYGLFFLATVQSNMCFSTFLQGRMFSCSAECCSRPSDSMSQVHQCIDRCHTPLAQAQGLVTSELEKFQVRGVQLSTCANDAFPVSIRLISSLSKKLNICLKNSYFCAVLHPV